MSDTMRLHPDAFVGRTTEPPLRRRGDRVPLVRGTKGPHVSLDREATGGSARVPGGDGNPGRLEPACRRRFG